MTATEKQEIEEVLRRVVEEIRLGYDPEKIILFGSYASGEPNEESDIDLFIVKESDKSRLERFMEVRRLVRGLGLPTAIAPLVYTPAEVNKRVNIGDDFVKEVLSKGRVLYARE